MAKESVFLRTPYNYDRMAVSDETGLFCDDPSLTQQHDMADCDINNIVERAARTGFIPNAVGSPFVGDLAINATDFHEAMNIVVSARQAFSELDAKTRARFGNDPGQLLEFLQDEGNYDEASKLGLVPPREELSIGERSANKSSRRSSPVENSASSDFDSDDSQDRVAELQAQLQRLQGSSSKKGVSSPFRRGSGDE
ncbi:internal scaffolding protein [Apis mellifera associated microvirus 2]|nr:internal scaffolding protein [Apis mellifera associated microvirus 2]